jgi:hypothetical protein
MQPLILKARAKSSVVNTIGAVNVVNDILLEALKQESLIVGSIDSETRSFCINAIVITGS